MRPHSTTEREQMDATSMVREALKVMGDAGVPERLEAAALPAVIGLVAGQYGVRATSTALIPYEPSGHPVADTPLDRLAEKLDLPADVVENVYTVDGNQLDISVHPGRLPRTKSTGTKMLALLVTALRQAGDEEFTPVEEIRRVAQEYDRYDGPNFASAIGEMRGVFLVRGPRRQRSLKLTRPGWLQAAELVRELGAMAA